MTTHLIKIQILPTLVVLLILAQVQLIGPCAQKLESGIQSFSCRLGDGKISICPRAAACGKSGRHQSHFVAEYLNFRLCESSQTLSASFQLAIEVIWVDYCQQKDRTSPRGSGISNSSL